MWGFLFFCGFVFWGGLWVFCGGFNSFVFCLSGICFVDFSGFTCLLFVFQLITWCASVLFICVYCNLFGLWRPVSIRK